jgi:hypothetical protein
MAQLKDMSLESQRVEKKVLKTESQSESYLESYLERTRETYRVISMGEGLDIGMAQH